MAGAVFGEVQLSLVVAGAAFGEIWNDSRSANCCIFQYKMLVGSAKSNLGCEAGCGRTVLWSDHGRILLVHLFSRNFFEILERHFSWQAQYLVMLEGNLCCSAHCK